MFDPAVLGTLLIGLDSARSDARQTDPRRDAAGATKRDEASGRRNGSFARLVGTLVASLLPQRASYEKHQRR